ncbi:hypothetical protein ISCGN_027946 [Ixodes scapularis]
MARGQHRNHTRPAIGTTWRPGSWWTGPPRTSACQGRPREPWTAATPYRTERQLARIKEDHVGSSHLLETVQSNKLAASRALSQNKELKRQLELTERLQKEHHVTKELGRADAERIARVNQRGERDLQRAIALVQRRRPDLQCLSAQQRHPPPAANNIISVIDMPDEV